MTSSKKKVWKCKLYYFEEYETCLNKRFDCTQHSTGINDSPKLCKQEKVRNYFQERSFDDALKANEWGQEQMYLDPECSYEIEEL